MTCIFFFLGLTSTAFLAGLFAISTRHTAIRRHRRRQPLQALGFGEWAVGLPILRGPVDYPMVALLTACGAGLAPLLATLFLFLAIEAARPFPGPLPAFIVYGCIGLAFVVGPLGSAVAASSWARHPRFHRLRMHQGGVSLDWIQEGFVVDEPTLLQATARQRDVDATWEQIDDIRVDPISSVTLRSADRRAWVPKIPAIIKIVIDGTEVEYGPLPAAVAHRVADEAQSYLEADGADDPRARAQAQALLKQMQAKVAK